MTERYLREAPVNDDEAVPQIYPGTLAGVTMAMKDAIRESKKVSYEWRVWAIYRNRMRNLIGIYEGGEKVWHPDDENTQPS